MFGHKFGQDKKNTQNVTKCPIFHLSQKSPFKSPFLEGFQDLVDPVQSLLLPPRHPILLSIQVQFPFPDPMSFNTISISPPFSREFSFQIQIQNPTESHPTRYQFPPGQCIVALQSSRRQASQQVQPEKDKCILLQKDQIIDFHFLLLKTMSPLWFPVLNMIHISYREKGTCWV